MSSRLTPRPDITNCDDDEKVERMVKWFFQNYEDAAERTPFESAEGGYQYIWGGPDDARDVLEAAFNDPGVAVVEGRTVVEQGVKDELIDQAVDKIEEEGDDWVPVPHEDDYK